MPRLVSIALIFLIKFGKGVGGQLPTLIFKFLLKITLREMNKPNKNLLQHIQIQKFKQIYFQQLFRRELLQKTVQIYLQKFNHLKIFCNENK